jgi:hypothetical protein
MHSMEADLTQRHGKSRQQRNEELAARINEMIPLDKGKNQSGTRAVIVEGAVWIALSIALWVMGAMFLV